MFSKRQQVEPTGKRALGIAIHISLFPSFSLPDLLCDPTELIWRKGTPFEAMIRRTTSSSGGLLVEVIRGFTQS